MRQHIFCHLGASPQEAGPTEGGSSSSHALWCIFASVGRGLDFLSPFGPPVIRWVYVWEFNPGWKEHQVACGTHAHARTHTHTHNLRSRCIVCFLSEAASAGRHVALMAQAQAAYWWADLVLISLRHSFVRPPTLSFFPSQHTHHVSDDTSRSWRLCVTGQTI